MSSRVALGRAVLAIPLVLLSMVLASMPVYAEPASRVHPPVPSSRTPLRLQEAAFLRTVDRHNTANVVTADLQRYAGTHIAYLCDVDRVVKPGLILGECGSTAEPLDLFIYLKTAGLRAGERLQVLGIMEPPAMWTDITGHTVYYAFIKALFVNRQT